jgi:hypothetical protein
MRGSIQHRPERKTPWRARYRGLDGRQRSKSFNRKIDAERWLRGELTRLDRGEWVEPGSGRITWAEYSAEILAARLHLGARTFETNRRCHERAASYIGSIELGRISPEVLRRLVSEMGASGYAPETTAKTIRWVKLTLKEAVADRRILSSPATGLRVPKPRRGEMRLLDPGEVELLAASLPSRYSSLPMVAAYTGLRWGELVGLGVTDIDMLRRRLTVRSVVIEASGHRGIGASGHPLRLGPPKRMPPPNGQSACRRPSWKSSPSTCSNTRQRTGCFGVHSAAISSGGVRSAGSDAKPSLTRWNGPVGSTTSDTHTPPG